MGEHRLHGQTIEEWYAIATTLYGELCKWGWGDFHYGHRAEQEEPVRKALAVYERAIGVRPGDVVVIPAERHSDGDDSQRSNSKAVPLEVASEDSTIVGAEHIDGAEGAPTQ